MLWRITTQVNAGATTSVRWRFCMVVVKPGTPATDGKDPPPSRRYAPSRPLHGRIRAATLPEDSIYGPARDIVEKALSQEGLVGYGIAAEQWADGVAALLLRPNPPTVIWKGEKACSARIVACLPFNLFGGMLKRMTKLDVVEQIIQESRK